MASEKWLLDLFVLFETAHYDSYDPIKIAIMLTNIDVEIRLINHNLRITFKEFSPYHKMTSFFIVCQIPFDVPFSS